MATIVRRAVDEMTDVTRQPGQDSATWDLVHLDSLISWLDILGHRGAVLEALQRASRDVAEAHPSQVTT